jgi:hypothetical protein
MVRSAIPVIDVAHVAAIAVSKNGSCGREKLKEERLASDLRRGTI